MCKSKRFLMLAAMVLAAACVATFMVGSAVAADTAAGISVKIGDAEAETVDSFAAAMEKVKAADADAAKVITLGEGTVSAADVNTFRIETPNLTIAGAGVDKTVINTGDFAISGQAGVLIAADNVTVRDLAVVSNNPGASGAAIKVTKIGTAEELPAVKNVTIANVSVKTIEAGFGLNLHGVEGATVTNVTVESSKKASVSIASASDVEIDQLTTGTNDWNCDIYFPYNAANVAAYGKASEVTFGELTLANGVISSERTSDATGGEDTLTFGEDFDMTTIYKGDGTYVIVDSESEAVAGAILNETTGAYYADIQSAIDTANAGDVIAIPEGEFSGNLTVDVAVTLKGAGADKTTIKFDKTMRGTGVEYFDGRIAYPTIYATADVTIEGLTIAGPTDEHHGIDGILAKAALTVKNVVITDIRCTADGAEICGVQYGRPIMVDGEGDVTIENVEIKKFQKQAIDLNTTGDITIRSVTITGAGEQGIIAQNGIVLRKGNAVIDDVKISGLIYNADNEWKICSEGLDLSAEATATVTNTTFENVDNNYGVWDDAVMTITEGNIVYKVTASSDGNSYGDKEQIAVLATGITLDKTTAELEVGGKLTLAATLSPENVTDKTLVWTSSDETIATVKDGEVTALKAGEVTITVKNGDVEATCTVTVKAASTPSEDESSAVSETCSEDESSTPSTSDSSLTFVALMLLVAAAGAVAMILRKRTADR